MNTLCLLEHKIGFIHEANPFLRISIPAGVLFNNSFKAIQVIMRFQYSARSRETFASNL